MTLNINLQSFVRKKILFVKVLIQTLFTVITLFSDFFEFVSNLSFICSKAFKYDL